MLTSSPPQIRPRCSDDDKQWYVADLETINGGRDMTWMYAGDHGLLRPPGTQIKADVPHPQAWEPWQLQMIGVDTGPEYCYQQPDHPLQIRKQLDAGRRQLEARVKRWLDEVERWRVRLPNSMVSLPSTGVQGMRNGVQIDAIPRRSSVKRMFAEGMAGGTKEDPIYLE